MLEISRKLSQEPVTGRQTPAEILQEALEPLCSFRPGSGLCGSCKRRRDDHPEMDELRDHLAEDGEI